MVPVYAAGIVSSIKLREKQGGFVQKQNRFIYRKSTVMVL